MTFLDVVMTIFDRRFWISGFWLLDIKKVFGVDATFLHVDMHNVFLVYLYHNRLI